MSVTFAADYVAGLFDGEGSVGLYPNGYGGFYVQTQVVQTVGPEAEVLWEYLVERHGGHIGRAISGSGRPKMNWGLSGEKAVTFLREMEPLLYLKRPQVRFLLAWYDSRPPLEVVPGRPRYRRRTERANVRGEAAVRVLKAMKKGIVFDQEFLDSVIVAEKDLVEVVQKLSTILCVKG